MSSFTKNENAENTTSLVVQSQENLSGYKLVVATFLSAPYTYNIVESTKYYANKAWDHLLEFTKLFVETKYVEKLSPLGFVVEEAVGKLHELGDKNINATIDRIITKIDDFVDPNVHHYNHPHHQEEECGVLMGNIAEQNGVA